MVDITKDDLIKIHEIIQEIFNITPGIKDDGLLESIAERPQPKSIQSYSISKYLF